LHAKRYLIIDRDTKYSDQFRRLIRDNGTKVIRLPPMLPNLNAYAERFVRSIKFECLNRMMFVGEASLRRAVAEYMAHYHAERNHQGLNNRLIRRTRTVAAHDGVVPPSAAWWDAQLLLPRSGVTGVDRVNGYYGIGACLPFLDLLDAERNSARQRSATAPSPVRLTSRLACCCARLLPLAPYASCIHLRSSRE